MTTNSDLGEVVRLACLTEDRAPAEQRAMLAVALRLDTDLARITTERLRVSQPPRFTRLVENTYAPEDDAGRPARLTGAQARALDALERKWGTCADCGCPTGAHYADDRCPTGPAVRLLQEALSR